MKALGLNKAKIEKRLMLLEAEEQFLQRKLKNLTFQCAIITIPPFIIRIGLN